MRRAISAFCLQFFVRIPLHLHTSAVLQCSHAINMQRIPIYHGMFVRYTGINDISASAWMETDNLFTFRLVRPRTLPKVYAHTKKARNALDLAVDRGIFGFPFFWLLSQPSSILSRNHRGREWMVESEQWISHVRPEPYEWICWPETIEIPPPDLIPI